MLQTPSTGPSPLLDALLLTLQLKAVPSKGVELRLHERRRQACRARVLQVLQRRAERGYVRVGGEGSESDALERRKCGGEVLCDGGVEERVLR